MANRAASRAVAGERPLVDLLRSGELEAVFTPFMPDGFFDADSDLRQLLPQCRRDEVAYFRDVGYVPGMHLLGIKPDILRAHPWVGQSLSAALDASAAMGCTSAVNTRTPRPGSWTS